MPIDADSALHLAHIRLLVPERILEAAGERHHLTPKECQLLETLLRHHGQVLTRQFLMKHVWQTDFIADTRTLEVHVHWLRDKIEAGGQPRLIFTVRSVGYVLRAAAIAP